MIEEGLKNIAKYSSTINIRYIKHTSGGNSGARNQGAINADTELLVFMDDDVTFDENCLGTYVKNFKAHPEMLAASGRVKPIWEVPPPPWLLNYIKDKPVFGVLALIDHYPDFQLGPKEMLFSCNMAIRSSVFSWTGFHPEIFGTQTIGDGETGLQNDINKNGGFIGYIPEAIAYHHIPAQRMTVAYIRKWAWHLSGCVMFQRWRKRKRTFYSLTREAISIIKAYGKYWLKDLSIKGSKNKKAIDIQFQATLGWSKLNYIIWMIVDSKVKNALNMNFFYPQTSNQWDKCAYEQNQKSNSVVQDL